MKFDLHIMNPPYNDDFYSMIPKKLTVGDKPTKHMWFASDIEKELGNILKYLKSQFAMFCLSILKTSANIHRGELKGVPYFPSYKEEWTKERIAAALNITKKEWAFIEKVIPNYYE